MTSSSPIKGLGEIALQVDDLEKMQEFYQDTVGLELLRRFPHAAFFRIADGVDGHTQILALFDRGDSEGYPTFKPGLRTPPLDHLAFGIALSDFETEHQRLENLGLSVRTSIHEWVQWRSLYIDDPEGNQVEWVCYDPSIEQSV